MTSLPSGGNLNRRADDIPIAKPPQQPDIDEQLEDLIELCHGNIWYDFKRGIKNPAIREAKQALYHRLAAEAVEAVDLVGNLPSIHDKAIPLSKLAEVFGEKPE